MTTKRKWMSPAEREPGFAGSPDEFSPEVNRAVAELRAAHGIDAPLAADRSHPDATAIDRRSFLQMTGAAAVLAMTAAGCAKHPDVIVPHNQQPDGSTVGNATWFSTVIRDSGRAVPAIVKTYDGRPIKIEGNPDDPQGRGSADLHSQSALLNLYDPDRIGLDPTRPLDWEDGPRARTGATWSAIPWSKLDAAVGAALASGNVALLTGPVDGPAHAALLAGLASAFPGRFRHVAFAPFADDFAAEQRGRAFGPAHAKAPVIMPGKAKVIIALGSCLLAGGTTGLAEHVGFGDFRRVSGVAAGDASAASTGQLIAFEAVLTQTGAMADVRVRVAPQQLEAVAWAIAAEVATALGKPLPAAVATWLATQKPDDGIAPVAGSAGATPAIRFAAQALIAAQKAGASSLVYVGGATHQHTASAGLHAAANWLNLALGNEGVTITGDQRSTATAASVGATRELLAACQRGEIATLLIADANPVGVLAGAAEALAKVPLVVALSYRRDETTALANLHAPGLHSLETWGDAETAPGVFAVQQPTVPPLWDARAWQESLLAFAVASGDVGTRIFSAQRKAVPAQGGPLSLVSRKQLWSAEVHGVTSWHEVLRTTWQDQVRGLAQAAGDQRAFWTSALSRGVVATTAPNVASPDTFDHAAAAPVSATAPPLQLVLSASRTMVDGGNLNNAWLQEAPDPISKITWDGYLAVSPKDAKANGWRENQVVTLAVTGGASVTTVVHVQEGQHPGVVELFFGWGRDPAHAGLVAAITSVDGFPVNAFALGTDRRWGIPVSVTPTGATYVLACVQMHHRMEGREIALDDVLDEYRKDPSHGIRNPKHALWDKGTDGKPGGTLSLWGTKHTYPGHHWGMAVDLSVCTGCNACVAACNAENNVPVVGRDEVRKGREMHWIRIDRYYSSSVEGDDGLLDIEVINQPVMCQQCENAPCEAVCPANATMKNDEGQNVQVYNRCIGTRYCSNNCPYKVRRFNWYQYGQMRAGPQRSEEPMGRIVKNVLKGMSTRGAEELAHMPLQLMLNPEVTVRLRGVMEKCNFCLARTRQIKDQERAANRALPDGTITTACAQTCPTRAITFGDVNDPGSQVAQAQARSPDAYKILDKELNTKPMVAYLRRIRNRPVTAADLAEAHPAAAGHAPAAGHGAHDHDHGHGHGK